MQTTERKAPKLPPLKIEETPAGDVLVSCDAGRVKLDRCPVSFAGRDVFKEWHEWPAGGEGAGENVRRQFHRARLALSWYDGEEVGYRERKTHSRATVNGVELEGYASAVYRQVWGGRDENGEDLPRPWCWDWDHEGSYVRRFGSAMLPPPPDGVREILRALMAEIVARVATPERLRVAESQRLERIAASQRERADELLQSAQECRERASTLYTLAAEVKGGPEPSDESEPERIIRLARR